MRNLKSAMYGRHPTATRVWRLLEKLMQRREGPVLHCSLPVSHFTFLNAAGLAIAATALAAISGCHSSSSTAAQASSALPTAAHVTATPPMKKTLRRESIQPGQIEAFEMTPLFAKFPSYVERLYVDIGDRVEADQPTRGLVPSRVERRASPEGGGASSGPGADRVGQRRRSVPPRPP